MSKIWSLVAVLACLVAATPAHAQSADTTPPAIEAVGLQATYDRGANVLVAFNCTDPSGIAACDAVVRLDTSTLGDHALTVHARDNAGNTGSLTVHYTVIPAPLTLAVTLGAPPRFTPFLLGSERDYTAAMTATLTASSSTSEFTVLDASPDAPGHLVNGTYALPSPLRLRATSLNGVSTGPGDLSAAPLTLLTFAAPIAAEAAMVTFTQHIGATDVLRTGNYNKTLTFTLSALTP
jgi:hypothetical protein